MHLVEHQSSFLPHFAKFAGHLQSFAQGSIMPCRKGIAARKKAGIFRDIIADWQLGSILEAEISFFGLYMALLSSCLLDSSTEWKAENLLYQTLGLLPFTSFLWRPCEGQPPVPAMPKQCCLYLEIAYDFGLKYHEKRWKKHEISVSELRVFTSKACWYLVHSCAAWQVRNCTWSSQRGVHRRQQTRERSLPNWQFLRLQHCPELFIHQNSVSLRLHCQITDALALTTVFWTCAFTRQLKLLNLQALEMQGKTHVVCGRVQISILMTTIQHAIVGQECESQQACLRFVKPVICIAVTFKLDQSSWSCPIF